jgi:glucosamine 6-phosphate synthetase-like amidotransferase/phosphosugar isomerase protein
MFGIVGGYARREIAQTLVEGLKRLEYRGCGSAGMVIADKGGVLRGTDVDQPGYPAKAVAVE